MHTTAYRFNLLVWPASSLPRWIAKAINADDGQLFSGIAARLPFLPLSASSTVVPFSCNISSAGRENHVILAFGSRKLPPAIIWDAFLKMGNSLGITSGPMSTGFFGVFFLEAISTTWVTKKKCVRYKNIQRQFCRSGTRGTLVSLSLSGISSSPFPGCAILMQTAVLLADQFFSYDCYLDQLV